MKNTFSEIKGRFGFGFMRLPEQNGEIDTAQVNAMVDRFLAAGLNYFDTARGYMKERSEGAIRTCLTSRYPREQFLLADKLSSWYFEKEEEIRPLFFSQLKDCGVDYFDFYLMHAQSAERFEKFKATRAYETAFALKQEGYIRHVGFSFHDKAAVLDEILTAYPQFEFVQLQFNYLDYEDEQVEGRKCYEVAQKHGKPVFVMEPVKGGRLVNLPPAAMDLLKAAGEGTPASYALRFAADFEGIRLVLSGMSDLAQTEENLAAMHPIKPLSQEERDTLTEVAGILRQQKSIPCTKCNYCTEVCPAGIPVPELFARWNTHLEGAALEKGSGEQASACLSCGACEEACPQKLPIRELLEQMAKTGA